MKTQKLLKFAAGAALALSVILLAGSLRSSSPVKAQDNKDDEEALIQIGLKIAPVKLNLEGKNPALVGLGSFLVNAVGDCDGCHTSGAPPNFNYANGGNPYFRQKSTIDPTTYLAGGTDFGPAVPPSAAIGGFPPGSEPPSYPPAPFDPFYVGPDIISRNLTPDKTGRPEGGHTLEQFRQILRNGKDFDNLHPTCTNTAPGSTPTPPNCIPPPVDGSLLQVMPWPVFHNLTDHQIDAIYEYLKSIPCISGPPTGELHNDCGDEAALQQGPAPQGRRHRGGHGK